MSYITVSPETLTTMLALFEPPALEEKAKLDAEMEQLKSMRPIIKFLWFTWVGDIDSDEQWLLSCEISDCRKTLKLIRRYRDALLWRPQSIAVSIDDVRTLSWYVK